MRLRSGFSFRAAAGTLPVVMDRVVANGWPVAPITDRASTFAWVRWEALAKEHGLRPVFGVELAVAESIHEKKPSVDHWTFLAIDDIAPINKLVALATQQFRYQPLLTYADAMAAEGVYRVAGHRAKFDCFTPDERTFYGLSGASAKGHIKRAQAAGLQIVATTDNYFPMPDDQGFYEVLCGRGASTQTYDQHIQSDEEWLQEALRRSGLGEGVLKDALSLRDDLWASCKAELKAAEIVHPPRPKPLREMCEDGAAKLGVDLTDPTYEARLNRELELIEAKGFEDYFYLVADLCQWARKQMAVGPARGSSCGSLACYLLEITTVDPIPHGLIFERFIDINRSDLPDIDIDFSDQQRWRVFDYLSQTYGQERVARLGTVAMYKARSALQEAGAALRIPRWKTDAVAEGIVERSSGDSRVNDTLEDSLKDTPSGKEVLAEWPEIMVAAKMEGHPRHAGQHAAGVVVASQPIINYVAVDHRTNATMCDKKDAEGRLGLLKIDALGLTQLSILEDALQMAGLTMEALEAAPKDDPAAFKVINDGAFSGIFQFNGNALRSLAGQVEVDRFDDIAAISALARPGPLATGGATQWANRRMGGAVPPGIHPLLDELTSDTYGVVIYQEQVMRICRELGKFSWADTSEIRKLMSSRQGNEKFAKFESQFIGGAGENGINEEKAKEIWDQINTFGSWAFNKCVSGDAEVWLSRTGGSLKKNTTIAELHDRFVARPSSWIKQKKSMPWVWSMDGEGNFVEQQVKAIHKNGRKECWRYSFDDGSFVECTPDHKFLINGGWKPAGEAAAGAEFAGGNLQPQEYQVTVGKGHAKGKSWRIGPDGSRKGAANPAWKNGVSAEADSFRAKMKGAVCEDCGGVHRRMEVHHNDFAAGADRPADLSWLCPGCHKRRHYSEGRTRKNAKGLKPGVRHLVSAEMIGELETYDLEMPAHHNFLLANGLLTHNSHAVAYGYISYWSCWMKAHHPFEFAAAVLSHESDPARQIEILREMRDEGYDYVSVDAEQSVDKWIAGHRDGKKVLVGPLQNVKGIGPKMVQQIIGARKRGEPMPGRAQKLLAEPATDLDSLTPIGDAVKRHMPDPAERNIHTPATPIGKLKPSKESYEALVFCTPIKINPRDENEEGNVQKRGGNLITDGKTDFLQLRLADDTGTVMGKINRFEFERLGEQIINKGRPGKSLWAFKGKVFTVGDNFMVLSINQARYIGDTEG